MINILCPTKSRPQAVKKVYDAWQETTEGKSRLIFVIDPDTTDYPGGYDYFVCSKDSNGMVASLNEASLHFTKSKFINI